MAEADTSLATPPAWGHLVGHDRTLADWRTLVASDRLPQVLLVTGREGIGKRGLLAALAAMHVCASGTACGTCEGCGWILSGRHPELLWLEAEAGRFRIEDAAALQDHLELSPGAGSRFRLAVIVDADGLTAQAANRLLKTLEEPTPRSRILLSTSRLGAMLPTVLSRCVRWRVNPPSSADSRAVLARGYAAAGEPCPDVGALDELLRLSGLAPGLALKLAGLGDGGRSEQPDLASLMAAETPAAVVEAAEALARHGGWSALQLLLAWEIELNRIYRLTVSGGKSMRGSAAIARRRDLLRQAKRLAGFGHVPLNAQLLSESLVFQGP